MSPPSSITLLAQIPPSLTDTAKTSTSSEDWDDVLGVPLDVDRKALGIFPIYTGSCFIIKDYKREFEKTELLDAPTLVALHRKAAEEDPRNPHRKCSEPLAHLVSAYETYTKHKINYDYVVEIRREVLRLAPSPHYHRSDALFELYKSIRDRYRFVSNSQEDLEESIILNRQVLEISPKNRPGYPLQLYNLADGVLIRYQKSGRLEDIEEVVAIYRTAVPLVPIHYPYHPLLLSHLATALRLYYDRTGSMSVLNEAIELHEKCLLLSPENGAFTSKLANDMGARFSVTHVPVDLDQACAYFSSASLSTDLAPNRFLAAMQWANLASEYKHSSALKAYRVALEILPLLAPLGEDIDSRQRFLKHRRADFACNAAAFALSLDDYDTAIEFLEQGRALFWQRALQLRAPLDELSKVNPGLAEDLQRVAAALEAGSFREPTKTQSAFAEEVGVESLPMAFVNSRREGIVAAQADEKTIRKISAEWDHLIERVQRLKGFERFLGPKTSKELSFAASRGPVVIINASKDRCDALIITAPEIPCKHVKLDSISLNDIQRHSRRLQQALRVSGRDASEVVLVERAMAKAKTQRTDEEAVISEILAALWTKIVGPIFRLLGLQKTDNPSRLWWYVTGSLAFLPIHAAGIYRTPDGPWTSQYIISSYTPTLSGLIPLQPSTDRQPRSVLTVSQPTTPGYTPLPLTTEELKRIRQVVGETLDVVSLEGAAATVETVISALPEADIVHLACHGEQNLRAPLRSALILSDGRLEVSRIMKASLPRASLVFLSACQTAVGDQESPNEAMHLAGVFLFAGFRGAIATMWSINDADGPVIAEAVYGHIVNRPKPDTAEAARGLHYAVDKLRKEGASFARWVPFIHLGSL